jgi:C1A family cysteine protease
MLKFILLPLLFSNAINLRGNIIDSSDDWDIFNNFKERFNKRYENLEEMSNRFNIFKNNLKTIISHNIDSSNNYTLGVNQFSDLTEEEFKIRISRPFKLEKTTCSTFKNTNDNVPNSWDWRSNGKVSSVRDQGQCGSCYSFSTMSALESVWAIKNNILYDISEQQIVDCAGLKYGDLGCNGGSIDNTFKYTVDNKMCLEKDYPYTAKDGTCHSCNGYVSSISCSNVPSKNQVALKEAVFKQPVSVAIEADTKYFQSYSSGILDDVKCGTNLDHAVVIVGYGSENGKDYWIVRNSWSSSWGENGYIRILRSSSTNDAGICGIALTPSFPIV